MTTSSNVGLQQHLTYKGNLKHTRYGWLRLTPAYSVNLVSDLLDTYQHKKLVVLDPFCGTGTTALVCAERGIESDTTDINPFLVWFARTKTSPYNTDDILLFEKLSNQLAENMQAIQQQDTWIPPLHQIEKWWNEKKLLDLSCIMKAIQELETSISENTSNLLKLAFCRLMIEEANVSFGHQSMSFKKDVIEQLPLLKISKSASSNIVSQPRVLLCDASNLSVKLGENRYNCVITSPPYPNRMSYIRELRPYMYWLGYLQSGRDAGELDWQAIGGTWGCATSKVGKWEPEHKLEIPYEDFESIINRIAEKSHLLSRYVHKYFYDILHHSQEIFKVVQHGGFIDYIVGNSKFYDVMLPVESIFAGIFEAVGFVNVDIRIIRKRTSKKELFEFLVSAQKP
jgi:hypothetical protein